MLRTQSALVGTIAVPRGLVPAPSGGLYDSAALTGWTTTALTAAANAAASPAGTTTATKLTEDSASNSRFLSTTITRAWAAQSYTASFYAKRLTGARNLSISIYASDYSSAVGRNINLSNGLDGGLFGYGTGFGYASSTFSTIQINGWWKINLIFTATADTAWNPRISMIADNLADPYAGDGASSILVWGLDIR